MGCQELSRNQDGGVVGGSSTAGGGGGGSNSRSGGEGIIDRSKVRILLCDNDSKSSEEAFTLLLGCSYQVTSVKTARQVIDALNAEGSDIDIILAEVDLPIKKGMKMLKYITRDKELQRIPVIMMSAQDEVSIVVKCLRLGAADYLVKPLRINELLNLWTHMWRRRRMLGLAEKNFFNYDFDPVASDPSDANTNSTTLFSDDTDDKSRRVPNPETGVSAHQEDESAAAAAAAVTAVELPLPDLLESQPDVPGISDRRTGQFQYGPKKSELKVGESSASAFFTYVKSSMTKNHSSAVAHVENNAVQYVRTEDVENSAVQNVRTEGKHQAWGEQVANDTQIHENGEEGENYSQGDDFPSSNSMPDSLSLERSCTPPVPMEFSKQKSNVTDSLSVERSCTPVPMEFPQQMDFKDGNVSQVLMHPRDEHQLDVSGLPAQTAYPYYMSGVVNQLMMPSSAHMYQKNMHNLQDPATLAMLSQYNHLQQCPPHVAGMASFPYYPVSICLQPGQMPTTNPWPSLGGSSSTGVKVNKVDRREAALMKFRQKRKERCFDKKIRYVNRKQLAERRPRVRGQFARKVNGVSVDLNRQPASANYEEDEEDVEYVPSNSSAEDEPL